MPDEKRVLDYVSREQKKRSSLAWWGLAFALIVLTIVLLSFMAVIFVPSQARSAIDVIALCYVISIPLSLLALGLGGFGYRGNPRTASVALVLIFTSYLVLCTGMIS
jgi:hypothetical protein